MSQKYRAATAGHKFKPTVKGLNQDRVRVVFERHSIYLSKYEKKVPRSWIENEWVEEVQK